MKGKSNRLKRIGKAIMLLCRQVSLLNGISSLVSFPNATTKRALWEAQARYSLKSYNAVDELFEELEE